MKCNCCNNESHVGGVLVDDYSGDDINNIDLINKLEKYLFIKDPITLNGRQVYAGYYLDTAIRYRNGDLDPSKETMKVVHVDKNIFSKLKEIWKNEYK